MSATPVTGQTVRALVQEVSTQHHALAGAVIALSAASAAALGRACMAISREERGPAGQEVHASIGRMAAIQEALLDWCDRDATAIGALVALREAGEELGGQRLLCMAPAEVGNLAVEAASLLQEFRPRVCERVQDDLEMSISLLAGAAQAAMLLLDSNLRIWPEAALGAEFEPIRAELERRIERLRPVRRIRDA